MTPDSPRLILRAGRDKSVRHRHPWIFSGAIERVDGHPASGDTVAVVARDGAFLAWAAYCLDSQITARAWSFDAGDVIDEAFLRARLKASIERRGALRLGSDALRLVHGESDGLPGLIVERYADTLVVQILSAGAEKWRELWPSALVELSASLAGQRPCADDSVAERDLVSGRHSLNHERHVVAVVSRV